jgi:alpha-L-rhamnosidase
VLALTAGVLGDEVAAARYERLHRRVKAAFNDEFISPTGRVVSDTPTAISIALVFDLFLSDSQRAIAGQRLVELVKEGDYRIQTGFAGTPVICDALTMVGEVDTAYHLLLQEECPSWLYPVTMGATTVWERWDSMLPNGDINPGEMTSFNHYALGAVVDFLHRVVAGLAPAAPGYRTILVEPRPGGGLTSASAAHLTPFGRAEVAWERDEDMLRVDVTVPAGVTALIRLPDSSEETVGPGAHRFEVPFAPAKDDAKPEPLRNPHEPKAAAQLPQS